MQQFLASGDPILVAEALAWADINPGVLDISSHSLQNSSQAAIEVEGERHSSENDVG
ncbi:hypothetical protein [Phormidesmis sp. 146-33]